MVDKVEKATEVKKEIFEKVKDVLLYTGTLLSLLSAAAYLTIVYILVYGFSVKVETNQLITFLALGALTGVLMNLSMRIQGIDFAKQHKDSKSVMKEMSDLLGKSEVKLKPIWVMFAKNILVDIFIKGGAVGFSLYFSIEMVVKGMGDSKYFLLGVVNVLLYLGFGMLSLAKSYDYYIERHIPYMQQKIKRMKGAMKNGQNKSIERKDDETI